MRLTHQDPQRAWTANARRSVVGPGNDVLKRKGLNQGPARMRLRRLFLLGLTVSGFANVAIAGTITFGGTITQSTPDGTGPASNNPALSNIQDLQAYTVTLAFLGSITTPGTYDLTGSSLTFSDPAAPASETSFGDITLVISAAGAFNDLTLKGCLTTGSGCDVGNQLSAMFRIPSAGLNSQNVVAIGLDPPHPLDLLEDDGVTDIQGTITSYSYDGAPSAVPEPSPVGLVACFLAGLVAAHRIRIKKEKNV